MPLKVSSLLATVTGSRRRTGAPRSQRGTRLKATTDRAFLVSAGFPPAGANTEEACPSLPGVRAGSFPTNPRQHSRFEFFGLVAPPSRNLAGALLSEIIFERVPSLGRLGGCYYDRTNSGIPAQPPERGPGRRALPRRRPRS